MKKNILLTGEPGVGKTTLIQKVIQGLPPDRVTGFYTGEIREGGRRVGFEIVTLSGQRAILSHIEIKRGPRVGKYGVALRAIEEVIVPAIQVPSGGRIVVIDEIGKMECASPAFREAVVAALDGPDPVLATIARWGGGFIDAIKGREDVETLEVRRENRDALVERILKDLRRG